MIEVTAKLGRGSVYFAGEKIHCTLRFQNCAKAEDPNSHDETIAWASAQIHCFCCVNDSRVVLPQTLLKSKFQQTSGGPGGHVTSFLPQRDEQGHCVLQTPVKILFCDLSLAPGESKLFHFQEVIPSNTPPSYRGPSCKYSYKLTLGTQRVGAPIKLLRIPFRVLVVYGLTEYQYNEGQLPSNPFLEKSNSKADLLEIASEVLSTITSRRSFKTFKIANSRGLMGIFSLMKTSVKIGEDIVGVFSFTEGTVPCLQYTVCLQSEEVLAEECQRSPTQGNALISYCKHIEFCLYVDQSNLILPIPLHVTPSFLTDLASNNCFISVGSWPTWLLPSTVMDWMGVKFFKICLKWKLHFEFITATGPVKGLDLETGQSGDRMWQGPGQIATESMTWDVPIQILPTMPTQAENIASTQHASVLHF